MIIGWIRSGAIWLLHLATPCTRWSVARTSGTTEPAGGIEAARFTVTLIRECRRAGVYFTLENPLRSRLWAWRPLARELRAASAQLVALCQCRFGTPFKKPTRLAVSHPGFAVLGRDCRRKRHREVLQGMVFVKNRWRRAYADVARLLAPAA